ncbi:MAG: YggT family protein [Firmicutes bacterium]|nr:YggT family protein [Bacillota bacterium]
MAYTLYTIVRTVFRVYYLLLLARILLSWMPIGRNTVTGFIYDVTEPFLAFFRRLIPIRTGMIDFSPIFAFIALGIMENIIVRLFFLF